VSCLSVALLQESVVGRRAKVLVLDDNELVADAVCMALGERFDVRGALSQGEFDALLSVWVPDVVLTDVEMPGVTGGELCRRLKGRPETQSVVVVLFSGLPARDLAALAARVGADAYHSKADGIEHLRRRLDELCKAMGR
jgi:PleD family two-component response regulator